MVDVAVIGGGIAGNFTAYMLSKGGLSVKVIEEDHEIGMPRFCTGVVGTRVFEEFGISMSSVRNSLNSAKFFSPSGFVFHISRPEPQAYVLDRDVLDQEISKMAISQNVEYLLSSRCFDIRKSGNGFELLIRSNGKEERFHAAFIVFATGVRFGLLKKFGFKPPPEFVDCAQVEREGDGVDEVEVYLGQNIAPGSFAWIVPVSKGKMRVGVSAGRDAVRYLEMFMKKEGIRERFVDEEFEIRRRIVPLGVAERTVCDRMLLVGDCAGQVKPTTFGGIYFSLVCASIAADTIIKGFQEGDLSERFLRRYEECWREKLMREIRYGMLFRRLLSRLPDEGIDGIIKAFSEGNLRKIIQEHADFDMHRRVIIELFKSMEFWKVIRKWIF